LHRTGKEGKSGEAWKLSEKGQAEEAKKRHARQGKAEINRSLPRSLAVVLSVIQSVHTTCLPAGGPKKAKT
jgi:hypothetical protein